ncbi:MAG: hypothetical protein R3E31_18250 [Chloroflexota bacterium]|nr:hypothetical protein [Anaerolineales bacterium]MCB8967752.1 hypothetical protein [Ardenticatenaceae bacterium]
MATQCEMIIGYLVPHRCPNQAITTCIQCHRQFCDEHVSITPGGLVCTACQQGLDKPVAVAKTAQIFTPADFDAFDAADVDDFEDGDTFADLS